jgi:hypothetical protein
MALDPRTRAGTMDRPLESALNAFDITFDGRRSAVANRQSTRSSYTVILTLRGFSPLRHLWRDIETYLATNPDQYCFVRLIYSAGDLTEVPEAVEYGVVVDGSFRVVRFPNR